MCGSMRELLSCSLCIFNQENKADKKIEKYLKKDDGERQRFTANISSRGLILRHPLLFLRWLRKTHEKNKPGKIKKI